MDTQSELRPLAPARSFHDLGVVSPATVLLPPPAPSLTSEILHTKVHSVVSLAMVATFAVVVGVASVVAGQERIAAAYMENPGPQHQLSAALSYAQIQPKVLGATTSVPAPVTSLSIRADFVSYLYRCMLQREPDQAGVDFWAGTMATDPDPVNHLYRAFYEATEFNKQMSNTDFVNMAYRCILFRQPNDPPDNDFSGRDFWVNNMNNTAGSQTDKQHHIMDAFLSSGEYNDNILPKLSALPVSVASPQSPVTISLSASPLTVSAGGTVYLSWSVANADSGTISFNNGIGAVGTSGNKVVNPTATTTYTLTGSNSLGAVNKSVTITVTSSTGPSVSVTSPQAGESWTAGASHPIVWTTNQSSTIPFNIVIYSLPANCSSISCGTSATLISGDTNPSLYNWAVPANYAPGRYIISLSLYTVGATGQSGIFNITAPAVNAVSAPTISPSGGTFSVPQAVSLSDATANASIRYTIDGSEPTSSSTLYSTPFTLSANATVKARAFASGKTDSAVTSASFVIGAASQAALPVISPSGGTFSAAQTVTITDATSAAAIYYTMDGSEPSLASPLYFEPLILTASATVKAKAFASGFTESAVAAANFVISTQPTASHKPIGYLDAIDPNTATVYGWSYDPDDPGQPVLVHFYIDGLDHDHLAGFTTADLARPDVNSNPVVGAAGNHGFAWTIPTKYQDGQAHTLYAFGIDLTDTTGASNVQLSHSPQVFSAGGTALSKPVAFPTTADQFAQTLYTCILGRGPADAELASLKSQFNAGADIAGLYTAQYATAEFAGRNLGNADFIHNLYYCLLFRQEDPATADKDGFNYWLDQANHGRPREATVEAFLLSTEFTDNILPKLSALRQTVSTQTNIDPRFSVVHIGGAYPQEGASFMVDGAKDARDIGFQGIEVAMSPFMCSRDRPAYQTTDWCDSRLNPVTGGFAGINPKYANLGEMSEDPRYQGVFNMGFKTILITAETINPDRVTPEPNDCVGAEMNRVNLYNAGSDCYKNGFSQRQLKSFHDDYYSLFAALLRDYAGTNKTFVIQVGNELENHFENGGANPEWAMNNVVTLLNTASQALADAKAAVPANGVKVYDSCEFTLGYNADKNDGNVGTNYVVPRTHCDLYGWSSWDYTINHPTDDDYVTKALNYYASKAPDSPDFGSKNVYLSEFGYPERLFGSANVIRVLNNGIDKALDWGVPYINFWALYDGDCTAYPATKDTDCKGHWIRKPASDPTQLGPLSDVYLQVFDKRKQ